MAGEEVPDKEALRFAFNHEHGQQHSPSWRQRFKSQMDVLNDIAGYGFEHYGNGHAKLGICQHFVEKVGPAMFIPFHQSPTSWANHERWEGHNVVYRRKTIMRTEGGKEVKATTHLRSQNCAVAIYENMGHE